MIILDPHKAVASIIKRRNGDKDPASAKGKLPEPSAGDLDPRHMAAEDVMAAISKQSIPHLMEALKNFHDMHSMHREMEEQMGPRDEEDLSMESDRPEL